MYSLDVNFLKDRNLTTTSGKGSDSGTKAAGGEVNLIAYLPVLVGLLVGGAAFAGVFVVESIYKGKNEEIAANIAGIDAQIQALAGQDTRVQELQGQLASAKEENQMIAGVFTTIRPWSAILQDVKDQTPAGVQISTFTQSEENLTLQGYAKTFNDVNDFLLTLKKSQFFDGPAVYIKSAKVSPNPTPIVFDNPDLTEEQLEALKEQQAGQAQPEIEVELPDVVEYTIQAKLQQVKAYQELERKGSVGLAARLRTLEEKGVITP